MKKILQKALGLALGTVMVFGCIALVGCEPSESPVETTTPAITTEAPVTTAPPEEAGYVGDYVMTNADEGVSCVLTFQDNQDFILVITREFDGCTGVKTYIGPMKNISGSNASTMPVFLSDMIFTGEKAPSQEDLDRVVEKIEAYMAEHRLEPESERQTHLVLDLEARTFTLAENYAQTLDPTESWWFVTDLPEEE